MFHCCCALDSKQAVLGTGQSPAVVLRTHLPKSFPIPCLEMHPKTPDDQDECLPITRHERTPKILVMGEALLRSQISTCPIVSPHCPAPKQTHCLSRHVPMTGLEEHALWAHNSHTFDWVLEQLLASPKRTVGEQICEIWRTENNSGWGGLHGLHGEWEHMRSYWPASNGILSQLRHIQSNCAQCQFLKRYSWVVSCEEGWSTSSEVWLLENSREWIVVLKSEQ